MSSLEVISKGYCWFILQVGKMLLNLRKILSKYYIFEKSLHYYAHRDQHILCGLCGLCGSTHNLWIMLQKLI